MLKMYILTFLVLNICTSMQIDDLYTEKNIETSIANILIDKAFLIR